MMSAAVAELVTGHRQEMEHAVATGGGSAPVRTERIIFFTMVLHPASGWIRVGKAYGTRDSAKEWLPFVRGAWRCCKVKVEPCRLEFENGKLTKVSIELLDRKFNMDPPEGHELHDIEEGK